MTLHDWHVWLPNIGAGQTVPLSLMASRRVEIHDYKKWNVLIRSHVEGRAVGCLSVAEVARPSDCREQSSMKRALQAGETARAFARMGAQSRDRKRRK